MAGWVAHAAAFWRLPQSFGLRTAGMALTTTTIGFLAVVVLISAF